jgi:hypothetical protein
MSLIGTTGRSFFDVWTIVHVAFWLVFGANARAMGASRWLSLLIMFVGAAVWEVAERFGEKTWPNVWLHREVWYNSWISDIFFAGVIGVLIGWWLVDNQ